MIFPPDAGPDAPTFNPPGGAYSEYQDVEVRGRGTVYVTTAPHASYLEFEQRDGKFRITNDVTLRAYVIDSRGLRSPIAEAAYTIEDGTAPVLSESGIYRIAAWYYGFRVRWDLEEPRPLAGAPNPNDDLTDWHELQFAVFSSLSDNIVTIEDAQANGTIAMDWRSWNSWGWVGEAEIQTSRPGERRYVNVFVRDEHRNTTGYGTVRLESKPVRDLYLGREVPIDNADDTVWLNRADGGAAMSKIGFTPLPDLVDTHAVALRDMDGDGLDDLVACYEDGTAVLRQAWFRATGGVDLFDSSPRYLNASAVEADDMVIADFDGDGSPDVAFANRTAPVAIYAATGEELFTLPLADRTEVIAAGDVNGDGFPDLVTGDTTDGQGVQVWRNDNGSGFTRIPQGWVGQDLITNPVAVHLRDLDRDGYADLIVAGLADPVQIYYGSSDMQLVPGPVESPISPGWWAFEATQVIGSVDWNGDDLPDLVLGNDTELSGKPTSIYLNLGDRTFALLDTAPSGATVCTGIAFLDVNGDGRPDFIETMESNSPHVWINFSGTGVGLGATLDLDPMAGTLATGRLR